MVEVTLLGIAQDGGRPQAGCTRPCCQGLTPSDAAFPVALGITDGDANHLIEATRCLGQQLTIWGQTSIDNVFLTHAHFGHVDGLGLFGKETMNARNVGLYISSEMEHLVDRTPQWSLMVDQGVFAPSVFHDGDLIQLSSSLTIQPLKVPHRDELSDMHAFILRGPNRSLLFLPDHDTWEETLTRHNAQTIRSWLTSLKVDIALVDGTFWSSNSDGLTGAWLREVVQTALIAMIKDERALITKDDLTASLKDVLKRRGMAYRVTPYGASGQESANAYVQ